MKKSNACGILAWAAAIGVGLATTASAALTYSAQSGAWSDTGTWTGGIVPTVEFQIGATHTVTATGVSWGNWTKSPFVYGTLNLDGVSVFNANTVNNNATTVGGVINVNSGAALNPVRIEPAAGGDLTVNVNTGGVFVITSTMTGTAKINVYPGGTATFNGLGTGVQNLRGGRIINVSSTFTFTEPEAWDSGEFVPNTSSFTSSTRRDKFQIALQYNPVNLLNLSNKQVKQTLTAGQDLTFTTACTIRANVYSSTAGDNDNFAFTAAYKFKLSSPVTLRIEDCDADGYVLPGVVADYLNKKYTLVTYTTATDFSKIVPTLAPVTWRIGGKDYGVTFQNDLATDGSVTVTGLTDLSPVRKETCILLR